MNQPPPNHLAGEKSPYLQQHVTNPVDWYPWGDEAFRRATEENKPVFLSIGYATCHWCHVMARESFEDPGIAGILKRGFIAVKVDREERPDIDSVYMTACQQMTGQGGWPLTIIMTPDKKPFFAGTYLPRRTRAGMIGLSELLQRVMQVWQEQRDTLVFAAEGLTAHLAETNPVSDPAGADRSLLHDGFDELARVFDPVNGGFGRAPRFPSPAVLMFLMRYGNRTGSGPALRMAEETLEAMRCGGIHDHLGGGFHRYATDPAWRVPHFEKMLYDQALLLMAFTEAWLITGKPVYKKTADSIITYVLRDLVSPEGAFISAEDADSFGGEGAFYCWTWKELVDVLGPQDSRYAAAVFNVGEDGNFPSQERGAKNNILYLEKGFFYDEDEPGRYEQIRQKLYAERERRPRPRKDTKILTDWNGLMIAALSRASRAFENTEYFRAAESAMRFLLSSLRQTNGGLLHRYCDGDAAIPAFADDYASVIHALIRLYEADFDPAWLREALTLTRYLDRHFTAIHECGYYTVSDEGDPLIVRKKEIYDGAVPSSNSLMLNNLVLLGHLTGDPLYDEQASRLADCFSGIVRRSPSAYSAYLCGLDHLTGPATDVVIAGERSDPVAKEMIRMISCSYLPSVTVHFRTPETSDALDGVAPFTRGMATTGKNATAYVCSGRMCSAPLTDPRVLHTLLEKKHGPGRNPGRERTG